MLGVADPIVFHRLMEKVRPVEVRYGESDCVGGSSEPGKMVVSHEDAAPVRANCFIDPVAIEKPMIEDGDDGLLILYKPVIEVNPHGGRCYENALKKAWALWMVSSYSRAGSESATMPAPTWRYPVPFLLTRVLIKILKSKSPLQLR